jgi:hypothetical protein
MAQVFGLTITGLDKVVLSYAIANKNIKAELQKEIFQAGTIIQVEAQRILTEKGHVVTGNLRRSINTQVVVEDTLLEVDIGTNVEYAPYIEALPDGGYLFPAYWAKKDEVMQRLQRAVKNAMDTAKGS